MLLKMKMDWTGENVFLSFNFEGFVMNQELLTLQKMDNGVYETIR